MSEKSCENKSDGACQATHEELCNGALKDYERMSNECCSWHSLIPKAIEYYRDNFKPKVKEEKSCENCLNENNCVIGISNCMLSVPEEGKMGLFYWKPKDKAIKSCVSCETETADKWHKAGWQDRERSILKLIDEEFSRFSKDDPNALPQLKWQILKRIEGGK